LHNYNTLNNTLNYNHVILLIISDAKSEDVYSDFAQLLSSANEVISAEVPNTLREIAKSIPNPEEFQLKSDDQMIEYLKTGDDTCCIKFRELLKKHGHRGYREFDVLAKQWNDNPLHLIKSIILCIRLALL